jgi:SAM-dependent methyltransferase
MRKVARVVSQLAGLRQCDLLDVGCGPGTLQRLLPPNVHYHGVDISIPVPADNLIEKDILQAPVDFRGMKFDFVVAQGMFEYVGDYQSEKFAEIAGILARDGKFVLTYQQCPAPGRIPRGPRPLLQDRAIVPGLAQLEPQPARALADESVTGLCQYQYPRHQPDPGG